MAGFVNITYELAFYWLGTDYLIQRAAEVEHVLRKW